MDFNSTMWLILAGSILLNILLLWREWNRFIAYIWRTKHY